MEDWRKYADIIDMEHPEPRTRPRMAAVDRATQFASFAALTGYDEMVEETSRLTEVRIELDEEQKRALDGTLTEIIGNLTAHPPVRVVHFVPDKMKNGGEYVTSEGRVRNVEPAQRLLILKDGPVIGFDDILFIKPKDSL